MRCPRYSKYSGGKTEIVTQMLNDKRRQEAQANIAALIKAHPELEAAHREEVRAQKLLDDAQEKKRKLEEKYNVYFQTSSDKVGTWKAGHGCRLTKQEVEDLQRAQNLSALGARKAANVIYDDLIEKNGLVQP